MIGRSKTKLEMIEPTQEHSQGIIIYNGNAHATRLQMEKNSHNSHRDMMLKIG